MQSSNCDFALTTVPELSGQSGKVRLRLLNMPYLHSRSRNATKFIELPDDEFHLFMLSAIDENIRAKEKSGFLKKTYLCRQCQAKLETQQEQPHLFEFGVSRSGVPAFQVQIEIPAVMCPACGAHNVIETPALESDIIEAQTEAFFSVPNL
jgi:hypothetical protein